MKNSQARIGYIVGGCALAYAIFFLLVTTAFDTNDDVSMMLMSAGFLDSGKSSAHWPFTSLLIAKPITALYRLWPGWPWYGLYLYATHFVASCTLVYVALHRPSAFPRSSIFVCLAALVSLELLILTRVQFTSVGLVLATAAIALWVHACLRGSGPVQIATAGLLFGLAYNVRALSAEGALLFMLPVVVLTVATALRRRQFGALLAIPVAIGVCALNPGLAKLEYGHDAAWQSYFSYNQVRGSLHQTPKLEPDDGGLTEAVTAAGWSSNDLYMFKNWFFADRDVFSQAKLESFLHARNWVVDSGIREGPVQVVWSHVNRIQFLFVLATALALALCQSWRTRLLSGVFLLWGLALIGYLILLVRFPDRVSDPIALCLCVGLWLIGSITASTDPPKRSDGLVCALRSAAIALACVMLAYSLLRAQDSNDVYARNRAVIVMRLNDLKRIDEAMSDEKQHDGTPPCSKLFVAWADAVPLQLLSPWITATELPDIDILGLGSRTHSPPFNAVLEARGIEHLPLAIFQRSDVLLIAKPAHYGALIDYVREHYGLEGQLEPVVPELASNRPFTLPVVQGVLGDANTSKNGGGANATCPRIF